MYASSYGNYEIAKLLIDKGIILNPTNTVFMNSPLFMAANNGYLKVVELLVENGANVMQKGDEEITALDIAMKAGHGDIAKYLRKKMLNLDETSSKNKSNLIKQISWLDRLRK